MTRLCVAISRKQMPRIWCELIRVEITSVNLVVHFSVLYFISGDHYVTKLMLVQYKENQAFQKENLFTHNLTDSWINEVQQWGNDCWLIPWFGGFFFFFFSQNRHLCKRSSVFTWCYAAEASQTFWQLLYTELIEFHSFMLYNYLKILKLLGGRKINHP